MSTSDDKGASTGSDEAKAPAEGEGAVKPHVRRRSVAKSASTAERPGFQEVEAAEPPPSIPAAVVSDAPAPGAGAPAGAPAGAAGAPAAAAAADPRGTGKTGDGRWDMRAKVGPASNRPGGYRGAPRGGEPEPARRPGASGGRAMPFIPRRDDDGRPVQSDGPPREGRPPMDRGPRPEGGPPRDHRPRLGGGPRPDRPRFDGPRPPRAEGGPPRAARAEGGPPRDDRRPARDDRPRDDRPARAPEARLDRRPQPVVAPAPPPKTVAETIFLGLPKAEIARQQAKEANKPKTAKEALRAKTLSKPRPETGPKSEAIALQPAWIAAGADAAVDAVRSAGSSCEALVDAWIKAANVAALNEVEGHDDVPGSVRKAAKRGLQSLRGKGIATPERRAAAPVAKPLETDLWEATFLPPDGRGTLAFTIAKKQPDGRLHVAEVIARETQGIAQAATAWLSRTQLREGHKRAADRAGIAPVSIPVEWARLRIAEARKLNAGSGVLLPLGLENCRELVEPVPASADHPLAALEAQLDADAKTAPAATHNEPEFRGWLPDGRAIDDMLRKLGESLGAEGAKEPERVSKGLEEQVRDATDRYFTPEVRTTIARRLRDAAISVRVRLGDVRAKEILATARAVESAGLITSPPRDVPFLVAFFQKAVAMMLQQGNGALRIPMAPGAEMPASP